MQDSVKISSSLDFVLRSSECDCQQASQVKSRNNYLVRTVLN